MCKLPHKCRGQFWLIAWKTLSSRWVNLTVIREPLSPGPRGIGRWVSGDSPLTGTRATTEDVAGGWRPVNGESPGLCPCYVLNKLAEYFV